jgi:lysophospholipase L1-like esterase
MITNPQAKTILCYGDSNTNGQIPASDDRFPANVRWTGVLQSALGDNSYIIEEGMGGRTVNLDDSDRTSRNGQVYFEPCVESHMPLNLVVIMLGTNDLKVKFHRSIAEIVSGLEQLVQFAQAKNVPVLLISPIHINMTAPDISFFGEGYFDQDSETKSKQLETELENLAAKLGCAFAAASAVAQPGSDGLHMDAVAHKAFGNMMAQKIEEYLARDDPKGYADIVIDGTQLSEEQIK